MPLPILIDCDPGIDDSVAILFALANKDLSIESITTVSGNLLAEQCSFNARKILKHSGLSRALSFPVSKSKDSPLVRPYKRDPFSYGVDGLGELDLSESGIANEDLRFAPDAIIETANKLDGKLTVLCLGPLTNLALAIMKDPPLPSKIKRVYFIGGSFGFHTSGSVRATGTGPTSEWNVVVDPEAANIVFSAFGTKLTAIGLYVATRPDVELSPQHLVRLRTAMTPAATFLLGVIDWGKKMDFKSWCTTIDSIAVAVCLDDTIIETEEVRCAVETKGDLTLGMTVVDRREKFVWEHLPLIRPARDINAERFLDMLVEAICDGT